MMCACMHCFRMFASIDILYEFNLILLIFNLYNVLLSNKLILQRYGRPKIMENFMELMDVMVCKI
jgi:hypothetical protein